MTTFLPPQNMYYALAVVVASSLTSRSASAEEPAQRFLEALRQRGYYDVAIDYLDRMESSPLAPDFFKDTLSFEKAVTLIEDASQQRDAGVRERRLDQAQDALRQFMDEQPDHAMSGAAKSQLGNLFVERARLKAAQSQNGTLQQPLADARKLYDQAYDLFTKSQQELRSQLEAMPKLIPLYDVETQEKKKRLRAEYVQSQLLAAAVLEDKADASPPDSEERKKLLTQAATKYGQVYEKYRDWHAGMLARMYQGRTRQKSGEFTDALACYDSILTTEGNDEEIRRLKTKSLVLAVQCLTDPTQKKYTEAVQRGSKWIADALPHESEEPEWMLLRLGVIDALEKQANAIRQESPRDRRIRAALEEARELALVVSRQSGPYQEEGRIRLAQLGGRRLEPTDEQPPSETFSEAKAAGLRAIEALQTAQIVLQMVPQRIADETDETQKQQLQQQLADAQRTLAENRGRAMEQFRLALSLADQETPRDELNDARYYVAYLYFKQDNLYDAAVMGEFVGRRWPSDPRARACTKIAHAAYVRLYSNATTADRSFEMGHLQRVAEYIVAQWPSSPEAADALNTLIPLVIAKGDFEKAEAYLEQIPEDSPRRAYAELQTGKALWGAYLRGVKRSRDAERDDPPESPARGDPPPDKQTLEQMKQRAAQSLTSGIERMRQSGEATATIAEAVLALAQIYVDTQQFQKAVELLEDPKIGALSLIQQNHPAAATPGFAEDTYKTALRAYISSLRSANRGDQAIAKAREIMAALRRAAGDTPEGQERLVATYYSLAMDLKRQLELVDSPAAREALSQGFETFLEQVGQGSQELNVIYWVAETFAGMADQYPRQNRQLGRNARRYFTKARDTYARILDNAKAKPGWLAPDMATQVRIRLAGMQRELGEYRDALDILTEILRKNSALLNAQTEGALTYQEWAANDDPRLYLLAMRGGRKDAQGRPTIWGWGKIAQLTAGKSEFRDTFHQARFSLAFCRYMYAMKQEDESLRKKELAAAKRDIGITYKLYRDLGGAEWEPKYNLLMRKIQENLGEPIVGVEAIKR